MTTRAGGVSQGPYQSLNLGDHVADDNLCVVQNRALLSAALHLPAAPIWLNQIHGTNIVQLPYTGADTPHADGCVSRSAGQVCAVMTADCLPILLCDNFGTVVAAAHAGWRGLAAGVIENTVNSMAVAPDELMAWLGPAIGPDAFEVGPEVVETFVEQQSEARHAFRQTSQHHWLADIYKLARLRLQKIGIHQVSGGEFCTYTDSERFYSFRRDKVTGRMAALIWLVG
jgi:YfiH family protein